tara:strand:- start:901 stop:1230 length:330 start_codon:yes stop_codon:yes gene_type:complete
MDKTMFKGYVRELVREAVNEELKRQLPIVLSEVMGNVPLQENTMSSAKKKPAFNREEMMAKLGLEKLGDTLVGSTNRMVTELPPNIAPDNPVVQAINKDYSKLMKAMGI